MKRKNSKYSAKRVTTKKRKTKTNVADKIANDFQKQVEILMPYLGLLKECAYRAGLDALVKGKSMVMLEYSEQKGLMVTNVDPSY